MALKYYAFIYLSPGFSPEKNTVSTETENCRFKAVGLDFSEKARVVDVAKQLVSEGVQLIELCGGFGPTWIVKINEAINHAVPVGGVYYGPEARRPLLELLEK